MVRTHIVDIRHQFLLSNGRHHAQIRVVDLPHTGPHMRTNNASRRIGVSCQKSPRKYSGTQIVSLLFAIGLTFRLDLRHGRVMIAIGRVNEGRPNLLDKSTSERMRKRSRLWRAR